MPEWQIWVAGGARGLCAGTELRTRVPLVQQHSPVGLEEVYVMSSGRCSLKGKLGLFEGPR